MNPSVHKRCRTQRTKNFCDTMLRRGTGIPNTTEIEIRSSLPRPQANRLEKNPINMKEREGGSRTDRVRKVEEEALHEAHRLPASMSSSA